MKLDTLPSGATDPTITAISSDGIQKVVTEIDLGGLIAGGKFVWIDMVGGNEAGRAKFLGEFGIDPTDMAWAQRFEQPGSMAINRGRLLAVTWLAERSGKNLIEVHILGSKKCVLTLWNGNPAALDEIHKHFAERAMELERPSRYNCHCAATPIEHFAQ